MSQEVACAWVVRDSPMAIGLIAREDSKIQDLDVRPSRWTTGGDEPDPRWSLANERTLLAYSRTALGLVVAGLAIAGSRAAADLPVWFAAIGLPVIALGASLSIAGRRRFFQAQQAMRLGEPLPAPAAASLLPLGIALIGSAGLIVAAIELAASD